jgi:hypothetical protein
MIRGAQVDRSRQAGKIHLTWLLLVCIALPVHAPQAGETAPLPFAGLFESPGGFAREKIADGQWRDIPQDVQLSIARDADIVELRIRIQVSPDASSAGVELYTIANDTWLVSKPGPKAGDPSDRIEFDVYKKSRGSDSFEDRGDGFCQAYECRYSYVTLKSGREQRYLSRITWYARSEGMEFSQSGELSFRLDGELRWTTYKTWDNDFRRIGRQP